MQLRLCAEAHRRGREREARLHPGRVPGRAPHSRQMGLCAVPDADPGAGAGAGDRQGPAHRGAAGPGAGGEVRRSPAAVSPGRHLRARWPGHTALDAGAVGRCLRRAAAAAGRCAEGDAARASSAARRRDAGGDAQAGQGEHAPGVYLELQLDAIRCRARRRLRLRRQPRRGAPEAIPRRLVGQARLRRLLGVQGAVRRRE